MGRTTVESPEAAQCHRDHRSSGHDAYDRQRSHAEWLQERMTRWQRSGFADGHTDSCRSSSVSACCSCRSRAAQVAGFATTHAAVTENLVISRPLYSLPATIALPAGDGPAPSIVFFAGSGPTDRDWTSPLMTGRNGSAAQLAVELQERGVGSIRFDKVGSGVNMPRSAAPEDLAMLEVLSLVHYVDEAIAAFDELADRDRCGPVFLLGHSEGSIHASSAAIAKQADSRFGGFISMSGPSRSILDTAIEQIRAIHAKAGTDPAAVDAALQDFRAAMLTPDAPEPDLSAVPEAAGLWQAAHSPVQQKVARELMLANPLASLPAYRGRALVVSAANDAQVPGSDADVLFAALGSDTADKTRVTIADANHVYKSETRPPSKLSPAEIMSGYADDGHPLAAGLVDAIVAFVKAG